MTTPDPIRAALGRLITMASDELTTPGPWAHSYPDWTDAIATARAALEAAPADGPAVPEVVGPTIDDIWELCEEHSFMLGVDGANEDESANGLLAIARAVLARWGRPTVPPAPDAGEVGFFKSLLAVGCGCGGGLKVSPDQCQRLAALLEQLSATPPTPDAGEVGELVALIRQISLAWEPDACLLGNMTAGQLTRAAALLEQLSATPPTPQPVAGWGCPDWRCWMGGAGGAGSLPAPQPVAVSERPDWRCWMGDPGAAGAAGAAGSLPAPPTPQPVAVSDAAVFALTESLGMIAMKFAAESMKKSRHDEACRRMRSDARQVILEWLSALPLPTTTPAGQEGADA